MRRFLILLLALGIFSGVTAQTSAKKQAATPHAAVQTTAKKKATDSQAAQGSAKKQTANTHAAARVPAPPKAAPTAGGGFAFPVLNVAGYHSASFGELRPTHFHAGVDIKTDGVEGRPLVAVADGYISRLSVTAGGYGRALYLTLNDGRTAVYGHIAHFRDDLEQLVDVERRHKRSNSARLWFAPGQIPVRKGDVIAYAGNSGSSMGPHLHFELRDTAGTTLNLVRMGIFHPADNIQPIIMRLHYLEIDSIQGVCAHTPLKTYNAALIGGGRYRLLHDGPIDAGRKGIFILEASDRRNGVNNTFGLYRASLSADGDKRVEYRMDGIPSGFSRYSGAATYQPLKAGTRNEVLRMAQLAGAPDYFYPAAKERGVIRTAEGETKHIRIEAEDDCGNLATLEFDIRGHTGTFRAQADSAAVVLRHNRQATVRCGADVTARIPSGALYESVYCRPELRDTCRGAAGIVVLSPVYRILDAATPLHKDIDISIRLHVPAGMEKQAALAFRTPTGQISHIGGKYAGGLLTAQTTRTGDLLVVADTTTPVVRPLFKEGADLTQSAKLRFRATDNFSGIAHYSLRIDGAWVPCDRYPMKGTLTHTFSPSNGKRKHNAELIVSDACGNTTCWKGTFYR